VLSLVEYGCVKALLVESVEIYKITIAGRAVLQFASNEAHLDGAVDLKPARFPGLVCGGIFKFAEAPPVILPSSRPQDCRSVGEAIDDIGNTVSQLYQIAVLRLADVTDAV